MDASVDFLRSPDARHLEILVMQDAPASPIDHRPARLHYLVGIDGLRAISVLAVLIYHNYAIPIGRSAGPLPGGFLGVEVFFVISGYLITSLLLDERRRTGGVAFKQFWFRRARRLLPALFLVVARDHVVAAVHARCGRIAEG